MLIWLFVFFRLKKWDGLELVMNFKSVNKLGYQPSTILLKTWIPLEILKDSKN